MRRIPRGPIVVCLLVIGATVATIAPVARAQEADAMLLAVGPIDLVGRRAQATLAAGYSLLELERAGLTLEQGRALGIPIDTARTSGVGANVMRLRQLMASR